MKKPFFVELTISAVVMAKSEIEAMGIAESEANEIARDADLAALKFEARRSSCQF